MIVYWNTPCRPRAGDDVYVRSAGGPGRPWYRRAKASGAGRIRGGGLEADVTFAEAMADAHADIDAAYHAKYDRYGLTIVGHVTDAEAVTIRLIWSDNECAHVLAWHKDLRKACGRI